MGLVFAIGGGLAGGYAVPWLARGSDPYLAIYGGAILGAIGGFTLGYFAAGWILSEDNDDQDDRARRNRPFTWVEFLRSHGIAR